MRVVIGPVALSSAEAWFTYARSVLADLDELVPDRSSVDDATLEVFGEILGTWELHAASLTEDEDFCYVHEVAPEDAQFQVHAFRKIAELLDQRRARTGEVLAPPESEDFYRAVITGVLQALDAEGDVPAAFAQDLRNFWPGQDFS